MQIALLVSKDSLSVELRRARRRVISALDRCQQTPLGIASPECINLRKCDYHAIYRLTVTCPCFSWDLIRRVYRSEERRVEKECPV